MYRTYVCVLCFVVSPPFCNCRDARDRRGGRFRDNNHRHSRAHERGWRKQKLGGGRGNNDDDVSNHDRFDTSSSQPPFSENSSNGSYWPHPNSRVGGLPPPPPPPVDAVSASGGITPDLGPPGSHRIGLPPLLHVPPPPPSHLIPPPHGVLLSAALPPPVPASGIGGVLSLPPPPPLLLPTGVAGVAAATSVSAFTATSTTLPVIGGDEDDKSESDTAANNNSGDEHTLDLDTRLQMLMKAKSANMPAFLIGSDSSDDDAAKAKVVAVVPPVVVVEGPLSRAPSPFLSREAYLDSYRLTSQQEELERVDAALASMPPLANGLYGAGGCLTFHYYLSLRTDWCCEAGTFWSRLV